MSPGEGLHLCSRDVAQPCLHEIGSRQQFPGPGVDGAQLVVDQPQPHLTGCAVISWSGLTCRAAAPARRRRSASDDGDLAHGAHPFQQHPSTPQIRYHLSVQ